MKLRPTLSTTVSLSQTLTPQQIQYLKLLQMPIQQLEQKIEEEISENPLLETVEGGENIEYDTVGLDSESQEDNFTAEPITYEETTYEPAPKNIDEPKDPFEFYRRLWAEDELAARKYNFDNYDDEESEPFPIRSNVSFIENMVQQLRLQPLKEEELILGEHILWNVDSDGYLRTPLEEIVDDTNEYILEKNLERERAKIPAINSENPATQFMIEPESKVMVEQVLNNNGSKLLAPVTLDDAERVLKIIQSLDPPGVASRDLRECLIAQTLAYPVDTPGRNEALKILTDRKSVV